MSMSIASSSFESHREWVTTLKRDFSKAPTDQHILSLSDQLAFELGDVPQDRGAPVGWSVEEQQNGGGMDFGAESEMFIDAEVLDDEPVYRSLGFGGGGWSEEVHDDEPVYRSLGDIAGEGAMERDVAEPWLSCMPPLVCRQTEFLVSS